MNPFWHPLSALLLLDPPAFATPAVLRLLLRAGGGVELLYAGDRMWPTVLHGQKVMVDPPDRRLLHRGDVVVGCPSGIPDLLRVEREDGLRVRLRGDSEPDEAVGVAWDNVLARARLPRRTASLPLWSLRRVLLDLREAWSGRPDVEKDFAETVKSKYAAQASFYAAAPGEELERPLLARIRALVPAGGKILVAGSGSGRECFALSREGWAVSGVDFAPSMVETARREAKARGLDIPFHLGDLLTHEEPPGSLDAVLFTYDVYSFIPAARDRVEVLRRMERWLTPRGVLLLSARRAKRLYERLVLSLQWIARGGESSGGWGASHTRWITSEGALRRSFVHVFTEARLRREVAEGGFLAEPWMGGHAVLHPRPRARS